VIEPERALRDVRASLREQVLPSVGSTHGRTILAAALGILDAVADQVQRDPAPAAATVAELLPAVEEWERELSASAPAAAAELAERRAEAAVAEPIAARETLLAAAERTVEVAWAELEPGPRDELLSAVRRAVRSDIERQRGGGR
jgi:hypothetical protein